MFFLCAAFLSENFKKSFAKAFQCAAKKDVNAQLAIENSVFPRPNTLVTSFATTAGHGSNRRSLMTNQRNIADNTTPLVNPADGALNILEQTPVCEDSVGRDSNFDGLQEQETNLDEKLSPKQQQQQTNEQFAPFTTLLTSNV